MSVNSSQIKKSIQSFLQLNNLTEALHAFRNEQINKNQRTKILNASQKNVKQLICVNKKQAYQLHKLSSQIVDFDNPEIQNQLRDHLQKTDMKILRKVYERIKKANKKNQNHKNQSKTSSCNAKSLSEMKFFKNLLSKQHQNYQNLRIQKQFKRNNNPLLQESRQYENQWQNPNELGYQINEFPTKQFAQVTRQLNSIRQNDYFDQVIKNTPQPQEYFTQIQQFKQRTNLNSFDKFYSRLPQNVRFKNPQKNSNDSSTNSEIYPLQVGDVVYDSYDLKIIYDRDKTGFQDQRDIKIVINEVLAGKYQIVSNLGQAQFSNAIQVKDLTNQKRYCLKIIQNNKQYFDQSLDEIKILRYIKTNCNPDQFYLLNLHDYFYHKEHLMLLTQLLKDTLLHAYQMNRDMFTNLRNVQIFTRQILIALEKLHQLHIAHTDLKPENIMIKSYTNKTLKVIDLGSSVFFHDEPSYYISTRSYRAPQIILGIPYDGRIDIWSLGCIVAEMFTGEVLFNAESSAALLALIQGLRGPWPAWMLKTGANVSHFFTKDFFIYEDLKDQNGNSTGKSRIYTSKMTNIKSRIKTQNKNFLDFLSKCLKVDPSHRMTATKALNHPFITETIFQ